MKKRHFLILVPIGLTLLVINSCRREPDLTGYPEVRFKDQVAPIISGNCTQSGCHDGSAQFGLSSYEQVLGSVTPYKAYKSSLYRAITGKSERLMPPGGPLSDDQIRTIFVWIEQGAPDN